MRKYRYKDITLVWGGSWVAYLTTPDGRTFQITGGFPLKKTAYEIAKEQVDYLNRR